MIILYESWSDLRNITKDIMSIPNATIRPSPKFVAIESALAKEGIARIYP